MCLPTSHCTSRRSWQAFFQASPHFLVATLCIGKVFMGAILAHLKEARCSERAELLKAVFSVLRTFSGNLKRSDKRTMRIRHDVRFLRTMAWVYACICAHTSTRYSLASAHPDAQVDLNGQCSEVSRQHVIMQNERTRSRTSH